MPEATMMTATDISRLAGEYALDTEHTRIGFVARHSMATKVRGRFDEYDGRVRLDGVDPSRSQVEIAIRAGSIQTRNRQRDGQLRGHFLDDRTHPVIRFGSTKVERSGDTTYEVTGDLTIRGVTKPVTVTFELT